MCYIAGKYSFRCRESLGPAGGPAKRSETTQNHQIPAILKGCLCRGKHPDGGEPRDRRTLETLLLVPALCEKISFSTAGGLGALQGCLRTMKIRQKRAFPHNMLEFRGFLCSWANRSTRMSPGHPSIFLRSAQLYYIAGKYSCAAKRSEITQNHQKSSIS